MYAARYPGAELKVILSARPHEGTEILAKANYKLYGRFPDEPFTFIFEYTIMVGPGLSPSIKVLAGETDIDAVHRYSAAASAMVARRVPED